VIVKNINGKHENKCKCGSWLQHWRNFSGQTVTTCRVSRCSRTDILGAHVQKAIDYDNIWYIVPLCNLHNNSTGSVELVEGTTLVSANVSQTCG
jgi:hypothetical protein